MVPILQRRFRQLGAGGEEGYGRGAHTAPARPTLMQKNARSATGHGSHAHAHARRGGARPQGQKSRMSAFGT
jgi:hypothetical protein